MAGPLIFLSHSGADSALARVLAEAMRRAGLRVWLDSDSLRPGDPWQSELESAVAAADHFVVLVGRMGVQYWVVREVRLALVRNTREPKFRIVPVLSEGADPDRLPGFLAQHHWVDLRGGLDDTTELKALAAVLADREPASVSLLSPDEPPFRGLEAFDAEHAHLFFGRDREVAELLDRLRQTPFLVVSGASGTGKSSLVRAGLIPALRRGRFHDSGAWAERWRVAVVRPLADPFGVLANNLPDLDPEMSQATRAEFLDKRRPKIESNDGLYNSIVALVPSDVRTLLVVDQFEELFTGPIADDVRQRFIRALLHAASRSGADRPVHVLLTLRADFLHVCWQHPGLFEQVNANLYLVGHLAPERLRETIERPLSLAGAVPEPGLVETILAEANAASENADAAESAQLVRDAGTLPLLQLALLRLWDDEGKQHRKLTHAQYVAIGRLAGAIEHHAESIYRAFDGGADQQTLMRRMFLRLIQIGEGSEPTRRPATRRELVALARLPGDGERVLDRLIQGRLLVARAGANETEPSTEIAHEALIRGWRRLGEWVSGDRELLLWRGRLRFAVEEWIRRRKKESALLHDDALDEARRQVASRGDELTEEERSFVAVSEVRARRQRRRKRGSLAAVAIVVGGLGIGGWWVWHWMQVNVEATRRVQEISRTKEPSKRFEAVAWIQKNGYAAHVEAARTALQALKPWTVFEQFGDDVPPASLAAAATLALPLVDLATEDGIRLAASMAWALDRVSVASRASIDRHGTPRAPLVRKLRKHFGEPTEESLAAGDWSNIKGGQFKMGDDKPHEVTVSAFLMLKHEVTNREFDAFASRLPLAQTPSPSADLEPVANVSWYEAYAYAVWLGSECRLPTEAEWEYAAGKDCDYEYCDQTGNKTALEKVARFYDNSDGHLWPIQSREPSPVGLYDMYGNAWEWVADWRDRYKSEPQTDPWGPPSGARRVLRGGSWNDSRNFARAAYRDFLPVIRGDTVGFRVVCSSPISR